MRSKLGGYSLFAAGALAALLAFGPTAPATLAFADDPAAATVKDDAVEPGATETDEGEPSGSAAAKADDAASTAAKAGDEESSADMAADAANTYMLSFDTLILDENGHRVDDVVDPADPVMVDADKPLNESAAAQIALTESDVSMRVLPFNRTYRGLYALDSVLYGEDANDTVYVMGEKIDPSKPVSPEKLSHSGTPTLYAVIDQPGCGHDEEALGVEITDKHSRINVPVYGPEYSPAADKIGMSITGVFDGEAVNPGDRVYATWTQAGGSVIDGVVKSGVGINLYINNAPATGDFGRITFTHLVDRTSDNRHSDGKLHDVVVEVIRGENVLKREIIPTTLVKGAKASITIDDMPDGYVMVCIDPGNLAHVATEEIPVAGNTGVKASGTIAGPNVPEGAAVRVEATELKSGDPAYDKLVDAMGGGLLTGVYDISMLVNGSQIHDGFGEITVTIPVDPQYNGQWMTLWHLHNDGTITSQRSIVKDGGIAFAVTDLSAFALELEPVSEDNGNTGADDGQNVVPEDKEPSGDSAPEQPAAKPEADKPAAKPEDGDKPAAQDDAAASPKGEVLPQTGDPAAILGLVAASGSALVALGTASKRRR